MAADPIIYCLEHITDYAQFERLCHDLMASEGFASIEPLGGMKDKGRDAIHVSRSHPGDVTIFAYSVREDWRKKLAEDAEKILRCGHACNRLVFLSTASFTPSERDEAVSFILEKFGWDLELHGLERLRILLATRHERIIAKHPQIFTPPFFPMASGVSLTFSPDYLVIDHKECDDALATWLTRRLALEGYLVWCRSTAPIAGASVNETIEVLLKQRAFRFITILSPAAVADPDISARRALASAISTERRGDLLIPIVAAPFNERALDAKTRQLAMVRFDENWQSGLDNLLGTLDVANCPRSQGGARIALRSFIPPDVLSVEPEKLLSNRFPVLKIPEVVHRFISEREMDQAERLGFSLAWSFRSVDPTCFLSFHQPPENVKERLKLKPAGGSLWPHVEEIDGIATRNLIPELVRKALIVASVKRGLSFCEDRKLLYFPPGIVKSDRLYFKKPDASMSYVNTVGIRTYWRPDSSSQYRYHLAPVFSVQRILSGAVVVVTRIRIRLTDANGNPLKDRTALSRRKHLCQDWWNDDWLHRILAVMQFLGGDDGIIVGQSPSESIVISTQPDEWTVPIGIDENFLQRAAVSRKDMLTVSSDVGEDEDYTDETPAAN